ncbi:lamin tail domain-containing protein [Candidatus Saccharibacteria bacterium]|nr:lamin tail domain-containing protein [Candidatus Saccharibacteria bacterium]
MKRTLEGFLSSICLVSISRAIIFIGVYFVWAIIVPFKIFAQQPSLLIVGIQTGGLSNAGQEVVELANVSKNVVDASQCQLQYFPTNPKDPAKPSRIIKLKGSITPGTMYILTTEQQDNSNLLYSATLSATGGHLRVVCYGEVIDMVGWGTATMALGSPVQAPAPGQKIERAFDENTSTYSNTGNNANDFAEQQTLTVDSPEIQPGKVIITELLPDPASPSTDANDEFIELYNADTADIDLSAYRLTTGVNSSKSFELSGIVLSAGQYLALFSSQTKLNLSNSGSNVRLMYGDDLVVYEVGYDTATQDVAYAWDGQSWQWTTVASPGQPNIFKAPESSTKSSKIANTSVKPATKKSNKSTTSSKTTKSNKSNNSNAGTEQAKSNDSLAGRPIRTGVFAGVGGLAVLYGAYEYKDEALNIFKKFYRNRKNRSQTRS